jgi:hypothetical protein
MMPAVEHYKLIFFDGIDESMLRINSARPSARKLACQSLRFSNPLERRSQCLLEHLIDAF